ncbi:hypothetical protein [Paenibacillus rhizoplanae]|uniref:hypothetical protein n=1 Tax=Paenibacillus rhizoplanae TaxID=1917181 RepID=UPI00361425C8
MLYYHYWSRGFRWFIGFLLAFILIALLVKLGGARGFDDAVIRFVQSMESPPLTALAKGLSLVGSSKLAVGISPADHAHTLLRPEAPAGACLVPVGRPWLTIAEHAAEAVVPPGASHHPQAD